MARNRIIYQSQAVALDLGAGAGYQTLRGVQSVNYGVELAREDVYQFGKLAAVDRIMLETPTVSAETSMYFPNGVLVSSHFTTLLANSIKGLASAKMAIAIDEDAKDFAGTALVTNENGAVQIIGANMSSFSLETAVGAIPTLTLGFEGTGLEYLTNPIGGVVDLNNDLAGEIVGFTGVMLNIDTEHNVILTNAQSANLSFDLGFEGLQRLGVGTVAGSLQYARVATLPATASLECEGIAVDRGVAVVLGSTFSQKASGNNFLKSGGQSNVTLTLGGVIFTLQKATLDSTNYTGSLGENATCSASFGVSISTAEATAADSTLIFA